MEARGFPFRRLGLVLCTWSEEFRNGLCLSPFLVQVQPEIVWGERLKRVTQEFLSRDAWIEVLRVSLARCVGLTTRLKPFSRVQETQLSPQSRNQRRKSHHLWAIRFVTLEMRALTG